MLESQKAKADGFLAGGVTPMQGIANDGAKFSPSSASKHGTGATAVSKNRKRRSSRSPSPTNVTTKPDRSRSPASGAMMKKHHRSSQENK